MATKAQVIKALGDKFPGAQLVDNEPAMAGETNFALEAPEGFHWEDGEHLHQCGHWYSGKRSEYWNMVLAEISMIGRIEECTEECEYWGE